MLICDCLVGRGEGGRMGQQSKEAIMYIQLQILDTAIGGWVGHYYWSYYKLQSIKIFFNNAFVAYCESLLTGPCLRMEQFVGDLVHVPSERRTYMPHMSKISKDYVAFMSIATKHLKIVDCTLE